MGQVRIDMAHVAALALAITFAAGQAAATSAVPAKSEDGKPYIGGAWVLEKGQSEAKTVAGQVPPLKPEAAALYAKRKQAKAGGSADDPVEQCLPHGVPRILSAKQPMMILQKPKQITVLYQANHQSRQFYIGDTVPKPEEAPDITYNGTAYARWSGNTLVVDTISFNDQTWLDDAGMPHSTALRTVERYDLVDPAHLKITVTVTDPETFTAPWEMQVVFKRQPGLRLQENACAEKLWHPPPSGSG
jgi:hypothetical protein